MVKSLMMLRCVYPLLVMVGIPSIMLIAWWRWLYYKQPTYYYPFARLFKKAYRQKSRSRVLKGVLFGLRLLALVSLLLATARLQQADEQSKTSVDGIDIMLVLDVSGSMDSIDGDITDPRNRLAIAKDEAMLFVGKRPHDQIGLVIFGQVAVLRCPFTLDKQLLSEIIKTTSLDLIDPDGTVLCQGLATAARHLSSSRAKSKVIIALTDGAPSDHDIPCHYAIDLIKKLGIKVYTIGIGSERMGYNRTASGGIARPSPLNKKFLQAIAHETGGQFFHARNARDMNAIYDAIDRLEKTRYESPLFSQYRDTSLPLLALVLIALLSEIILLVYRWVIV